MSTVRLKYGNPFYSRSRSNYAPYNLIYDKYYINWVGGYFQTLLLLTCSEIINIHEADIVQAQTAPKRKIIRPAVVNCKEGTTAAIPYTHIQSPRVISDSARWHRKINVVFVNWFLRVKYKTRKIFVKQKIDPVVVNRIENTLSTWFITVSPTPVLVIFVLFEVLFIMNYITCFINF